MGIYVADFETTTDESDCRVWAWAITDIKKAEKVTVGNTLESFIKHLYKIKGTVFFHNEKFDGSFIIDWLFRHNYKHVRTGTTYGRSEKLEPGTFSTLISDMGQWYSLKVCLFNSEHTIEFKDSLKLIPLSVEQIPKAFGLEEAKLTLDYKATREYGHLLTEDEEAYVKQDVIIVAKAVKFMIDNGQVKMTAASNALHDFKQRFGKKEFERYFPKLDAITDADIRHSYKGGWTFLNPLYSNKYIGNGSVYDVNSMYPWAMMYCKLPYGEPIYFYGKPQHIETHPLYVIQFVATFDLKPGKYPSIQIKHSSIYGDNEYIVKSREPTLLTLTSVDFDLFKHNYDYDILEYHGGYYFMAKVGMFADYINYWYQVKADSKRDGNKGMERIAKLMLNSLYGKFGMRLTGRSKIPYFDKEQNKVRYKLSDYEDRNGVYLPVATFITSYCRDKIIRAAEQCYDRFVYADTDSIHIKGQEPVPGLDVDDYRLGAFKLESTFERARFIRQKTYMEVSVTERTDYDGFKYYEPKLELKCAGMPQRMKDTVDEKDFYLGAEYGIEPGSKFAPKLLPKVVPGGVILREVPFKIR